MRANGNVAAIDVAERKRREIKNLLQIRREAKLAAGKATLFLIAGVILLYVPLPQSGPGLAFRQNYIWVSRSIMLALTAWQCYASSAHAYVGLRLVYLGFLLRLLEYELERKAVPFQRPNVWYVLFGDLQAYEDELREYVRHYRRNLETWIREERWIKAGQELSRQLHGLLGRYELSAQSRDAILEKWETIRNPKGKKRYLAALESRLAHGDFAAKQLAENGSIASDDEISDNGNPREETDRLKLLVNNAARLNREESRKLLEEATATLSRRDKIRLLKLALRVEAQANVDGHDSVPAPKSEESRRRDAEVQFLSLQDLAREKFCLAGALPPRTNAVMAREIILALLAPGKRGRRFQAAYRAEDTLRVMVRRQYEVHLRKQFDPKVFRETLSWLVNESVLFTKPKTDEQVFSLTSKTRGKSAEAQKVINAYLSFDRSLRVV